MKKKAYIRPLLEVVDSEPQTVVASSLTQEVTGNILDDEGLELGTREDIIGFDAWDSEW